MKSILYVCHGTQSDAGQREAKAYVHKLQGQVEATIQSTAFLEFTPPTIPEALDMMIRKEIRDILIMPILLFSTEHHQQAIPEAADRILLQKPHVRTAYGQAIQVHQKIPTLIEQQVKQSGKTPGPDDTILVVDMGSQDQQAKEDFEELVEAFRYRSGHQHVIACYLTKQEPSFSETFQSALSPHSTVFVVPYLLFTGFPLEHLQKKVREAKQQKTSAILCPHLSTLPELRDIWIERINEALALEEYQF
ncbi:sirohydrochlorin chelatase [Bacillaceae bacterium SIJ1]|uniref:sirohydrochlorin chelatase n=1 Tax=Litoribacterium kuwaitense TaxID=1398745 RepID=UPI0013E9BF65|nr:sirohydrochlorin chelatase [Litoribacterium kuwaitense]NGP46889.1 sirohydrochlorin chelatase [Litoribacterium kuwaitense]